MKRKMFFGSVFATASNVVLNTVVIVVVVVAVFSECTTASAETNFDR